MKELTLTIDDRQVTVTEGASVLDAAKLLGIEVPAICSHPDLEPYGACRMCVVEIEKVRGFPTACTTPAREGMVVRTQSETLRRLRENTLELMMSGHPNACLVCDYRTVCEKHKPNPSKAGTSTRCGLCGNRPQCDLREIALSTNSRNLNLTVIYSHKKVERDDPFIERDHNLCILCGLCSRICNKIHGHPAISITGRGAEARIAASSDGSWVDSTCTFCGACVDICPTGTISDRFARWHGAPDGKVLSTCTLCPEGCPLYEMTEDNQVIATRMVSFRPDDRLCALGRFAYPQLLQSRDRLHRALLREAGELVPVSPEEAVAAMGQALADFRDGSFLLIGNESELRETKHLYRQFAAEVMHGVCHFMPAGSGVDDLPSTLLERIESGEIRAVLCAGDYLPQRLHGCPEFIGMIDAFPSPLANAAAVVLPAAILAEVTGTFRDAAGAVRTVGPALPAPGAARPEWHWLRELAPHLDATDWKGIRHTLDVTRVIADDPAPAALTTKPRDTTRGALVPRFRGHFLADWVPALDAFDLPSTPASAQPEPAGAFAIRRKEEIAPNFHLFEVEAPGIARHARPGQFIMVMARETSERSPFTLTDWDPEAGTIIFIIEETGRSSRELCSLRAGAAIAHISGPLGKPLQLEGTGPVALAGGCYGIGAIYPFAKALHRQGRPVKVVLEASSHFLFFLEKELAAVCDELQFTTRDGSRGRKGAVHDVLLDWLADDEQRPDAMLAIGCTLMMQMAAEATRPWAQVPLHVALNPIMIDGTGMCGACRVSVDGATNFACVDGPFFNGHQVDWAELASRRGAFVQVEVEAMPQDAHVAGHGCKH